MMPTALARRPTAPRRLVSVALLALVPALAGCPAPQPAVAKLTLRALPALISDTGEVSTITLSATTAEGAAGAGVVVLATDLGTLSAPDVTLDAAGQATVTFLCDKAQDAACAAAASDRVAHVSGQWMLAGAGGPVVGVVAVTVRGQGTGDGGSSDGGSGVQVPLPDPACTVDTVALDAGDVSIPVASDAVALCDGWVLLGSTVDNSIRLFNAFRNETRATHQLTDAPHALLLDAQRSYLYVALRTATRVVRLDLQTGTQTPITLPAPATSLALGSNGLVFARFTDPSQGASLALIDGPGGTVQGTFSGPFGHLTAFDPVGSKLYTQDTSIGGTSWLVQYAFDAGTSSLAVTDSYDPGIKNGQDLAVSPDGTQVVQALGGVYTVRDADSANLSQSGGGWNVGPYPRSVRFTPDGGSLVASNGDELLVFGAKSHVEVARVPQRSYCLYGTLARVRTSRGGRLAFGMVDCGISSDRKPGFLQWQRLGP